MNSSVLDVIVIGAGHAGLSISYQLKQHQLNHFVFEQNQIGDSWLNQRWDSFKLNSANNVNLLPGQENVFSDAEGYISASEFASFLQRYSRSFQLPVIENSKVILVERHTDSKEFSVHVKENGVMTIYRCQQVIVASGGQNIQKIPSFAKNISPGIIQLHASEYKNAALLPAGAVLVVGSAQSGIQIAEDLVNNGRKVFVATSKVGRVPRRYRGKDILDWLSLTGFNDVQTIEIPDPQIFLARQPQVSGVGTRGHTSSLQDIARHGAVILGKVQMAEGVNVILEPNAAMHVKFADDFSGKVKEMIDDFILKTMLDAPSKEEDVADNPDETASCASAITSLNLTDNNITSIIWTTGFAGDFSYLNLPVSDKDGVIKHVNGISDIDGLYFIGLPWLRKRKSGIILGIREDSEYVIEKLMEHRKTIM
jgi:putative flavoprotein involved in K+ transport